MMAGLLWMLTILCAAGGLLTSSDLGPALVVQSRQNVSLTCNLTESQEVTWYVLRRDQLLPLLSVSLSPMGEGIVDVHVPDNRRIDIQNNSSDLMVLEVEESDAGMYFCAVRYGAQTCFSRGVRLVVDGGDGESTGGPCWTLLTSIVPAVIFLFIGILVGCYLCSDKSAVCCRNSTRPKTTPKVTEEETLRCSNLNLPSMHHHLNRGRMELTNNEVMYSTVMIGSNHTGSRDHRQERSCFRTAVPPVTCRGECGNNSSKTR
ncbi:uncharacterized protein [Antennarius striatus]|uniref:uncharacterized protein n=1 Tax=Antennarius striatus TaxID=241820 RepID=UPI0035AF7D97